MFKRLPLDCNGFRLQGLEASGLGEQMLKGSWDLVTEVVNEIPLRINQYL